MLTHGNIAANQNTCAREFSFGREDACISFLPLSHITARALDYVMYGAAHRSFTARSLTACPTP